MNRIKDLRKALLSFLPCGFLLLSFQVFPKEQETSQYLTFCFVGDTGHVTEVQKKVANSLSISSCNVIWHTGDIIYPDGISSKKDPRFVTNFLEPFSEVFKKDVPFFLTLGNHDYKKEPQAYIDIAKENPLIIYPNNYYFKDYKKLCFFALDTTIFDKLYLFYLRGKQSKWLKMKKEDTYDSCKFSVVVAHHPLFSSGDRKEATPQLARFLGKEVFGSFDLYIAGHNHVLADEGERQGTRQLISGTGSVPGGSPDQQLEGRFNVETPGFLRIEISETESKISAVYSFVEAEENKVIWSGTQVGKGIRFNPLKTK